MFKLECAKQRMDNRQLVQMPSDQFCKSICKLKLLNICIHFQLNAYREVKRDIWNVYRVQCVVSIKLLGGKLTPKMVYSVLKKELLKHSETAARFASV